MRPSPTTPLTLFSLLLFIFYLLFSLHSLTQPSPISTVDLQSNGPDQPTPPINPYTRTHTILNPNGTLTRLAPFFPTLPPDPPTSKDVVLDPITRTWARIYLPGSESRSGKLPILVFVHGGGFILLSAVSPVFHRFCSAAASQLGALVVSVDYRLAPEHRLPAQYDDVLKALYWVRESKDEWVKVYGDLSRCLLMGESAGGNIVYHVGVKSSKLVNDLQPLIIKGLVLIQPFFGGVKRTRSEIRLSNDVVLPIEVNDMMWNLALPLGANRSHPYCDPLGEPGSSRVEGMVRLGWPVMVVGCESDPLIDRQVELVKMMEKKGVKVEFVSSKGGRHGMFVSDDGKAKELFGYIGKLFYDL